MTVSLTKLIAQAEAVNPKGVKLEGEWKNFSKFASEGAIAPITAGQWCEVGLDDKGFIRTLAVGKPAGQPEPAPFDDHYDEALPTVERLAVGKDRLIAREVALKCASEFVSLRTDLKSCDLLMLAGRLEDWLLR
jgi:hypothetical protein